MIATRRCFLSLAALPAPAEVATDDALREAIHEAVGDAPVEDGGIVLRVPTVAENGGEVPLGILVDSPMTAADHVAAIPLRRVGRAEELADVAVFLCSRRASFVTGAVVRVDGGASRGF